MGDEFEFPTSHSCPVCTDPLRLARIYAFSKCKHVICRNCHPRCEFCPECKSLDLSVIRDPKPIFEIVKKRFSEDNIFVNCPQCEEKMKFLNFVRHDCPKELRKCPYSACKFETEKSAIDKHISECKHRTFFCKDCDDLLTEETAVAHRHSCSGRVWFLTCCETVSPNRESYMEHIGSCPMFKLFCKFCTNIVFRFQFQEHVAQCRK